VNLQRQERKDLELGKSYADRQSRSSNEDLLNSDMFSASGRGRAFGMAQGKVQQGSQKKKARGQKKQIRSGEREKGERKGVSFKSSLHGRGPGNDEFKEGVAKGAA